MNRKIFYITISLIIAIIGVICFWFISKSKEDSSSNIVQGKASNLSITTIDSSLAGNAILGTPTKNSIAINILAEKGMSAVVDYSITSGTYNLKTNAKTSVQGEPIIIDISNLNPNTKYYYRINTKKETESNYTAGIEHFFYTQRSSGSTFSFGVQGDSHPERAGKMFNSDLYLTTMQNVAKAQPDFYYTLGDDFSIEGLIDKKQTTQQTVDEVYLLQRKYLGLVGSSSSLFLVNGNHEQAAKYLLDGTATNSAVLSANARNSYFSLPAPSNFFSGDTEKVDNIGYLRDYYSYEWGDALFITIDPYWHSDTAVDNSIYSDGKKQRDLWNNTLGDTQYKWFKQTLENSKAKYKFVFTHHVLGTGRGGIEEAKLYEWGGYNSQGVYEFDKKRPGWDKPIQQLMADNHVTIFFQGHDHLFAKQELDGVVYQSMPNPADDTYTAFNQDAYLSGVKLPNSGFLNITVSPDRVRVNYIRSFLPKDENSQNKNDSIGYSYEIKN
ncbi:MAG: metallophosphoesterase family protein [bacterium]